MENRRLKKSVIYALYALTFVTIMGTIYLIDSISSPKRFDDNTTYVNDVILDNEIPVVSVKDVIIRPFTASNISVARGFYNYQDNEENQKNSLIYYEGTYMPNSGVDYKSDEIFDVVSILDGTVSKVTENTLLGKIVEITHSNNLISVYQSMSEVIVSEQDTVVQGQVIGKSGESNISTDLSNHLHFELILNGKNINPENCYDKKLDEL
jgi:stage II sporulation protein Q